MIRESYPICGGSFENAGVASSLLKARLKQIGVDPAVLRRIMIAAYEAEMNVVIHAHGGNMQVSLDDRYLDLEVRDEGPGIEDIDLAVKEGFSTAPDEARQMGFGAGMGLPNIRKNSDYFRIESQVGRGTYIKATINLRPCEESIERKNSIDVKAELCNRCLACVRECPTGALRVHDQGPEVLAHRCIDCALCIDACGRNALGMKSKSLSHGVAGERAIVVPSALLVQFGFFVDPEDVIGVLGEKGYNPVLNGAGWEVSLRSAVSAYALEENSSLPVISPVCPAVVNLVETRFPSLIPNLAPFLSPIEALLSENTDKPALCIGLCPAMSTAIRAWYQEPEVIVAHPSMLFEALSGSFAPGGGVASREREWINSKKPPTGILIISGMAEVNDMLERMENADVRGIDVVEPYLCSYGCFGSPLLPENSAVAQARFRASSLFNKPEGRAVRREGLYSARRGTRLHPNIQEAMILFSKIDRVCTGLPGRNCGRCGAPSCFALAEDIVLGRATRDQCVYINNSEIKERWN